MSRHPSTVASPLTVSTPLLRSALSPLQPIDQLTAPIETDGIAAADAMLRSFRMAFGGFGDHTCNLGMEDGRFSRHCFITRDYTRSTTAVMMERLNDTFDRIRYTMDNPDAALTFVDDVPTLVATDGSGIDHETLFKLGRS